MAAPTLQTPKTEAVTTTTVEEASPEVIGNYRDFDNKVLEIHRTWAEDPHQYIEVTGSFFQALTKGTKTPYLTWGTPGIKVYIAGTKPEMDAKERMSAETAHEMAVKQKSMEHQELVRRGKAW